ncbi:MAG: spore coat U domain-containing protein [Geminicoccaceae bacterium]
MGSLAAISVHSAHAQTANLNVSAEVVTECSLNAGSLNFGQYVSGQTNAVDQQVDVTIDCDAMTLLKFSAGNNSDGTDRGMRASGSADILNYQVYQDTARSFPVGDGTGLGTGMIVPGNPNPNPVTVYARLFGGQTVPADTYSDVIVVTMEIQ